MDDKAKLEKDIKLLTRCIAGRFQVWASVVDGENANADPCALCEEYVPGHRCALCPISEDGHGGCRGTPYIVRGVDKYAIIRKGGPRPKGMTCADAAAEVVYLVDLREKLLVRLHATPVGEAKKAFEEREQEIELKAASERIERETEFTERARRAKWQDEMLETALPPGCAVAAEELKAEEDERGRADAFFMKTTAEDIKRLQSRAQKAEDDLRVMKRRLGAVVEALGRDASASMGRDHTAAIIALGSVEAAIRKELGVPDEETLL